jgi:hypothetical protein
MTATEFWTAIFQRILGFIAVPLFIVIVFGKVFKDTPPDGAVWIMMGLIVAYWVWWTISFRRTLKVLRQVRAETKAG